MQKTNDAVNAPSGQHCLQHTRARAALAVPKLGITVELFEQIERLGRKVKGAAFVAIVGDLNEQVDLVQGGEMGEIKWKGQHVEKTAVYHCKTTKKPSSLGGRTESGVVSILT